MKKLAIVVFISILVLAGCSSGVPIEQINNDNIANASTSVIKGSVDGVSYKIGSDIPAGEYYIEATSTADYGEINVSIVYLSDVAINDFVDDTDINAMIPIMGSSYLTLDESDGYLYLTSANAYLADAKPLTKVNSDDYYSTGMYKIGVDIPAGNYTLEMLSEPGIDSAGYEITNDSTFNNNESERPFNLTTVEKTVPVNVSVEDGQYLRVVGCKLVPIA